MAYAEIRLSNGIRTKIIPIGFSWTMLFFGPLVPLFRKDFIWAVGILVGNIFTYGLVGIISAFFYNKLHIENLLSDGYYIETIGSNITEQNLREYLGRATLPMINLNKQ